MINTQLLKEILAIPSKYGHEERIRTFLMDYLALNHISHYEDKFGNIYAQKGVSNYYPCVIAHMDTVHDIIDFDVIEEAGVLYAKDKNGSPTGIGADNKAGILVCLELLNYFDNIKVAFFVSEEVGCFGSFLSDPLFFKDVGYAIQFDAPSNNWVTYRSNGVDLFELNSDFHNKINTVFKKNIKDYHEVDSLGSHPYTDVYALKSLYDFSCVNYSVGYYYMHTPMEYVKISEVNDCYNIAIELINSLGNELYFKKGDAEYYNECFFELTYNKLMLYKK